MSDNNHGKSFERSMEDSRVRAALSRELSENLAYQSLMKELRLMEEEHEEWSLAYSKDLEFPNRHKLQTLRTQRKYLVRKHQIKAASDLGYSIPDDVKALLYKRHPKKTRTQERMDLLRERLRRKPDGTYYVSIKTPFGSKRQSTSTKDYKLAVAAILDGKVFELEAAGLASRLTASTVSRMLVGSSLRVEQAVAQYLEWKKKACMGSAKTLENHRGVLSQWMMESQLPTVLAMVKPEDIQRFINGAEAKKLKPGTRRLRMSVMHVFFDYCMASGYVFRDPSKLAGTLDLSDVPFDRLETKVSPPMTDEEVMAIINHPETPKFFRLAVAIARWSGLRLGDVCKLQLQSFAKPGRIIVWTDKRDRRVNVPIEPELSPYLVELPIPQEGYYWPNERALISDPKRRSKVTLEFRKVCKKAGVVGKSFKCLRVSYAQMCRARNESMPNIAAKLGHAQIGTTEKHYAYA